MKENPKVLELLNSLRMAWKMSYHLELEGGKPGKFFKDLTSKIGALEYSLQKEINKPEYEVKEGDKKEIKVVTESINKSKELVGM